MTGVRARGEDIRRFILQHLGTHPADIAKFASEHFKITRQAVGTHLRRLAKEKAITASGETRKRTYELAALSEWRKVYSIGQGPAEDVVWREDVEPMFTEMPDNVQRIWHFGFTEMFNNAIDHSGGSGILVTVRHTAVNTTILITDDGVGIFKKIKESLQLPDERTAVLELAKGKVTTDPKNHTGQGIFFTSRLFDHFDIYAGDVYFTHDFASDLDWITESPTQFEVGTSVRMELSNHTARTPKKIFDKYSSGDDYGFTKTVVPVELARYGNENLVSRSQAKRLLVRVDLFKTVLFDFKGVPSIGQAFADEVFRVFQLRHPDIELVAIHANSEVKRMITRALSELPLSLRKRE